MIEILSSISGFVGLIVMGGLFVAVEYWMLTMDQGQ